MMIFKRKTIFLNVTSLNKLQYYNFCKYLKLNRILNTLISQANLYYLVKFYDIKINRSSFLTKNKTIKNEMEVNYILDKFRKISLNYLGKIFTIKNFIPNIHVYEMSGYKSFIQVYKFLQKLTKNYRIRKKINQNVNFSSEYPRITEPLKYIREKLSKQRVDLRNFKIFSVDPSGSLNIDDSIHFKFYKNCSIFELGIHISDVFSLLKIETEHQIKSIEKLSTIFLIDRKIDFFPPIFSSNLYSIRQGVDRLAFSIIFKLDHFSNILSMEIFQSVIRNGRSFSKQQLDKFIKKSKKNKICLYGTIFRKLCEIKTKLFSYRIKTNGKFQFNSYSQKKNLDISSDNEGTKVIEEFMLLCNVSTAEKILEFFPSCSKLRFFGKYIKVPISDFFTLISLPKLKIDLQDFIVLSKNFRVFTWKERKTLSRIYLKKKNLKSKINTIFSLKNNKTIELSIFRLFFPLYLKVSSPMRRISDLYSHFLISFIFRSYICMFCIQSLYIENAFYYYYYQNSNIFFNDTI
nr:exoribonuclease R [Cryptomonas sp.]